MLAIVIWEDGFLRYKTYGPVDVPFEIPLSSGIRDLILKTKTVGPSR